VPLDGMRLDLDHARRLGAGENVHQLVWMVRHDEAAPDARLEIDDIVLFTTAATLPASRIIDDY